MQRLTLKKDEFRTQLELESFANSGDDLERRYYAHLQSAFPRLEQFWRAFVVPLTNRLNNDKTRASIHFRDGVDPTLQYICGANYSLYVHLTFAKVILTKWDDASLDAVYTRLASAFDVFEALVIKFHLLMCECQNKPSPLFNELSEKELLEITKQCKKNHPKLLEFYRLPGKNPPSFIVPPTKKQFLKEYFKEYPTLNSYNKVSGDIRAFRNAIVHDVRVGRLKRPDGTILVPKSDSTVISRYRQWSLVEDASRYEAVIAKDFCEVKSQCAADVERTANVLNELYQYLLADFEKEFYMTERPTLRNGFGIEFGTTSSQPIQLAAPMTPIEQSSSGSFLYLPGTAPLSGVATLPTKEH